MEQTTEEEPEPTTAETNAALVLFKVLEIDPHTIGWDLDRMEDAIKALPEGEALYSDLQHTLDKFAVAHDAVHQAAKKAAEQAGDMGNIEYLLDKWSRQ